MEHKPNMKLYAFTIDCKEPYALAQFYAGLMGWEVVFHTEEWACVGAPGAGQGGYPGLLFQQNPDYVPPVWPEEPGAQQQMAHLDFAVDDVEQAVQHALCCGATVAPEQFSSDWTVMLDPAGHPFCLCRMKEVLDSPSCALL